MYDDDRMQLFVVYVVLEELKIDVIDYLSSANQIYHHGRPLASQSAQNLSKKVRAMVNPLNSSIRLATVCREKMPLLRYV